MTRKEKRKGGSGITLKKLFVYLLVLMIVVTSTTMFVYSGQSVDELWAEREANWRQQEHAWEAEIAELEKEKEQLDLVLSKHFIDHKRLHMLPYNPSPTDSHAIVTTFGTYEEEKSPAWVNALVLFQSLKETKTRIAKKVALSYVPLDQIPDIAKNGFKRLGVDLRFIGPPPREPPSNDWRNMWMRSQVFMLTEFTRVLYMDSESIAVDNIDHVFHTPIPADHTSDPTRLVFTALRQQRCEFFNDCGERRASSPRFFLITPDKSVGSEVAARINTKSAEISLNDMFSNEMHEILLWTPFQKDFYDWEVGECNCNDFQHRIFKTLSFGCLRADRIFEDVLGRMWTEKECTHEWFVLWIQLYSEILEKLPR